MKNKWLILSLLLIILLNVSIIDAQKQSDNDSKIHLTADQSHHKLEEDIYIFTGNVKLNYKQNKVTADKLRMDKKENMAYFSSNVHLTRNEEENKEEIWSDNLEFDLDEEVLVAKNNVKLDSTKNDKPLILTSNYLKLWTKSNDMRARENVFVDYDQQKISGEELNYTAEEEKMVVTEDVEIKEEGNWLKARKAILWLEENVMDAEGKVEMEFEMEE